MKSIRTLMLASRLSCLGLIGLAGVHTPVRAEGWTYPATAKVGQTDSYFGVTVADPYRWLEDDNSRETASWVKAENTVTNAYLSAIPYRSQIRERLRQVINYPKYSAPLEKAGSVFYYKNDGLQNQSVLYVQKGMDGIPRVLIDPNTLSANGTTRLGGFTVSKDGVYGAYAISRNGSDWQEVHFIEIATGKVLPDTLSWVKYSGLDWRGHSLYYSRFDAPKPGEELTAKNDFQKVYLHTVGTTQADDALIHEDRTHPDDSFGVGVTEDERFEILSVGRRGLRGNALFFRAVGHPERPFTPIISEVGQDSYSIIDNVGDQFVIRTNHKAPNSKVILYDPAHPDFEASKVVLPEKAEPLKGIATAGGKLFAFYLKDVTSRIYRCEYNGSGAQEIRLPGPGTAGGFGGEKDARTVFYTFSSYNYPPSIFRYDIPSGKSTLFRTPEVAFKPNDYEVRQVFVESKDGTKVPMFLTCRKGLKRNGTNPTLLTGYGDFNISQTPGFSASRIVWLEQGGILAVVNLRGGGEYGEKWHLAGNKTHKQNVFDDCIAAAEWLTKEKYTSPAHLALQGGSNGGLLVGAVINQRPDLFRAAIPEVGVMDMLRYQRFTAGKFWVDEYGAADTDAATFKNLYAYSPLHNIRAGVKYPATLITTADHDDRVVPAHSFKYAATLQEKADHSAPVLIRIDTNAGHGGSSLSKAIDLTADIYSFLFYNLDVTPKF